MEPKLIVIDGKTYKSVNDMPEDVRRQYEQAMSTFKDQNGNRVPATFENNMLADQNRNGIPDLVENTPGEKIVANVMKILVDGKQFNSLDDLPPEARARYEQAMGALDANRNGIPDFMEGMINTQQNATSVSASIGSESPRPISQTPLPVTPTITPDTTNGWMLALLAVLLLVVCLMAAGGVWYFFLR